MLYLVTRKHTHSQSHWFPFTTRFAVLPVGLYSFCQLKNVSMSKSDVIKTLRDNANATMRTDANSGMLEREVVEVEPITARRERSAANRQRGAYQLPLLLWRQTSCITQCSVGKTYYFMLEKKKSSKVKKYNHVRDIRFIKYL